MAGLELTNVGKTYPGGVTYAVTGADFRIADGEFIVLVGPSGCGKSTILRMIAGLETVTDGDSPHRQPARERAGTGRARHRHGLPELRALPAHVGAFDNMAYGLKNQGKFRRPRSSSASPRPRRRCNSENIWTASPGSCRAASASASPWAAPSCASRQVFLFDEPLSNLDAKLRGHMRSELKELHRRLDATFVFVTHDQVEAMSLADRIIIMSAGQIEQIGTPMDLYDRPNSRFVAEFIGSPPMNILDLVPALTDRLDSADIPIPANAVAVGVRPETISLDPDRAAHLAGDVVLHEALGAETILTVEIREPALDPAPRLILRVGSNQGPSEGARVSLALDPERLTWFDANDKSIRD